MQSRSCLFHYLRGPVEIPNIPAVILTIAALASTSHCQAPQRARRHGPKAVLWAPAHYQSGDLAQAPGAFGAGAELLTATSFFSYLLHVKELAFHTGT